MIFRKKYNAPIAERFAVEEDGRLLENSFEIGEGGDDDYVEAKPMVGGIVFEDESDGNDAGQIWCN